MTTNQTDLVVLTLLLLVLPAANLYPFLYAFRPWYRNAQGRALMVKAISNVILLDMASAYLLFGHYPGRSAIRVLGFVLLAFGINYLFISMLTAPGAREYPPWTWLSRRRLRKKRRRNQ